MYTDNIFDASNFYVLCLQARMKNDNIWLKGFLNPLNATGTNMHQVPMLTEKYSIERVNLVEVPSFLTTL